jgi:hypothetical protein
MNFGLLIPRILVQINQTYFAKLSHALRHQKNHPSAAGGGGINLIHEGQSMDRKVEDKERQGRDKPAGKILEIEKGIEEASKAS